MLNINNKTYAPVFPFPKFIISLHFSLGLSLNLA